MSLFPKTILFAGFRAACGWVIFARYQDCRGILSLDRFGFARAVTKNRHSNPIARGDQRAAPAASFSRLNPNRPGPARPETDPSQQRILTGRFRLSSNVIQELARISLLWGLTLDLHHPHVEYMTINLPVSAGLSEGGPRTGHEIQS